MSKFKTRQDEGAEEPPQKILRKCSSPQSNERNPPKYRKSKTADANSSLNICDLPTELLEKIIGYINIWHHNRIRSTCKRLKYVSDIFVMHEFEKALRKHTSKDPKSRASAVLKIIKQATEVYIYSGFESTFCGCMLPMLRSSYHDPFSPLIYQAIKFLVHFYRMVSERIGAASSQRWRLLYTVTLMRLIKAFDKSIISSIIMPLHWRIVVELRGPWLGNLWTLRGRPLDQSRQRCNLLVMLSEMLIANITERAFKHVWECPSEMYVFGNDISKSNHLPITLFTITVYGSKKICNLFRMCLEEEREEFQWPLKWPNDQFTVNLDIICREAMKWGCSKSQHMEIGPFSKTHNAPHANGATEDNVL